MPQIWTRGPLCASLEPGSPLDWVGLASAFGTIVGLFTSWSAYRIARHTDARVAKLVRIREARDRLSRLHRRLRASIQAKDKTDLDVAKRAVMDTLNSLDNVLKDPPPMSTDEVTSSLANARGCLAKGSPSKILDAEYLAEAVQILKKALDQFLRIRELTSDK